jgi:hypothetical protein
MAQNVLRKLKYAVKITELAIFVSFRTENFAKTKINFSCKCENFVSI